MKGNIPRSLKTDAVPYFSDYGLLSFLTVLILLLVLAHVERFYYREMEELFSVLKVPEENTRVTDVFDIQYSSHRCGITFLISADVKTSLCWVAYSPT
jgi:hypothetical protein